MDHWREVLTGGSRRSVETDLPRAAAAEEEREGGRGLESWEFGLATTAAQVHGESKSNVGKWTGLAGWRMRPEAEMVRECLGGWGSGRVGPT
jgi:hypothetical protein